MNTAVDEIAHQWIVDQILARRRTLPRRRAMLVAVTGIDASGKGYLTQRLVAALQMHRQNAVRINVDGWLNLPDVRFSASNPAEHFYAHALRLEEMFEQLVLPLKTKRSHRLVAEFAEETATAYREHICDYADVDVIVLEGIYLLKRAFQCHYDLSLWIDCTFETALKRALARAQEGLAPTETVLAYETIYFPAQRIHFERDRPRAAADLVIANDPRLTR